MGKKDPRVDACIAKSADFAKPILKHIRKLVHRACPDVEETIKWQFPTFMHQGMLCSMGAFKNHCTFGFWKHKRIFGVDHGGQGRRPTPAAIGNGRSMDGRRQSQKLEIYELLT